MKPVLGNSAEQPKSAYEARPLLSACQCELEHPPRGLGPTAHGGVVLLPADFGACPNKLSTAQILQPGGWKGPRDCDRRKRWSAVWDNRRGRYQQRRHDIQDEQNRRRLCALAHFCPQWR